MIGVVGLGFVGLAVALGFAHKGFDVRAFDVSGERRGSLAAGKLPFFSPRMEEALGEHVHRKVRLTDRLEDVVQASEVVFICVGTPADPDGGADLTQLFQAVDRCGRAVLDGRNRSDTAYKTLVIKSTVPPGTAAAAVRLLEEMGLEPGRTVGLGNNPEFLREDTALEDFLHPDRIVIGAEDERTRHVLTHVYSGFDAPVFPVSLSTAEFVKYLSNALLATLVSFANETATVAERLGGIDIPQAFRLLHHDRRWSGHPAGMSAYVYPGCGYGGSCLPKDAAAFYALSRSAGAPAEVLGAAIRQNAARKRHVAGEIMKRVRPGQRIAILGLSFKPGSDDVRDTPARDIIRELLDGGYGNVVAYDPVANTAFANAFGLEIAYAPTLAAALDGAGLAVVLTAWAEFRTLRDDFPGTAVLDGRYCL